MTKLISGLAATLLLCAVTQPAIAKKSTGHPVQPGKYTEWNGEIDELEIVTAFKIADYNKIIVQPFDTSATPLPEEKDETTEYVKNVLAQATQPFTDGLRDEIESKTLAVTMAGDTPATSEPRSMNVKCAVETMDPGSRAARYLGGFGAGAARAKLVCDVNDAASGSALLHFTQERRSGVGMFGGAYEKLMNKNLEQIGNDLAAALQLFE